MSYTFGALATDDINCTTTAIGQGGDNSKALVAGWFYPTTLTATRGYWGTGSTHLAVDTTTDELRITADWTTDGVYTTTGADIVVNEWVFIAVLLTMENTSDLAATRVWVGRQGVPPVIQTPAVTTAQVGAPSNGTAFVVGNTGFSASLAFQGDIGWVVRLVTSSTGINAWDHIGTSGAIAAEEAQLVEEQWVKPLWAGRPKHSFMSQLAQSNDFGLLQMSLCQTPALAYQWSHVVAGGGVDEYPAIVINGVTYSNNEPPVRLDPSWVHGRFARVI